MWLACFMHHDHIAYLTISYPCSGAKVPLALLSLNWIHTVGIVSTILLMSDEAIVETAMSFKTRMTRPASFPVGPVVNGGGQNTV